MVLTRATEDIMETFDIRYSELIGGLPYTLTCLDNKISIPTEGLPKRGILVLEKDKPGAREYVEYRVVDKFTIQLKRGRLGTAAANHPTASSFHLLDGPLSAPSIKKTDKQQALFNYLTALWT